MNEWTGWTDLKLNNLISRVIAISKPRHFLLRLGVNSWAGGSRVRGKNTYPAGEKYINCQQGFSSQNSSVKTIIT